MKWHTKIGRCANGAERDAGSVFHLVADSWSALCGTRPGRTSAGWSYEGHEGLPPDGSRLCEKCLKQAELNGGTK